MKLDKSPTLSPFSLDPKRPQSFPKIKFRGLILSVLKMNAQKYLCSN